MYRFFLLSHLYTLSLEENDDFLEVYGIHKEEINNNFLQENILKAENLEERVLDDSSFYCVFLYNTLKDLPDEEEFLNYTEVLSTMDIYFLILFNLLKYNDKIQIKEGKILIEGVMELDFSNNNIFYESLKSNIKTIIIFTDEKEKLISAFVKFFKTKKKHFFLLEDFFKKVNLTQLNKLKELPSKLPINIVNRQEVHIMAKAKKQNNKQKEEKTKKTVNKKEKQVVQNLQKQQKKKKVINQKKTKKS